MTTWIGTSWKMNKTQAEAVAFARDLRDHTPSLRWPGIQAFVVPPATSISAFRAEIGAGHGISVGAQNAHWEEGGAWTGELSVRQVADAGAEMVEIGHSERRQHFNESDRTINLKVRATLRHGLIPLVCIGETWETRARGGAADAVLGQVAAALEGVRDRSSVLLAYEPVWAIGHDGREPDDDEVSLVSTALAGAYGNAVAGVLYGGSVSHRNASRLLALPGISGLFVGRSAWSSAGFIQLLETAAAATTGRVHTHQGAHAIHLTT